MRVGWSTTAIFVDLAGYVFENFGDTASNTIFNPLSACSSLQSE